MIEGIQYTRSLYAAREFVQATFTDIALGCEDWCERIASLQREFALVVRLAGQRFEWLKVDLVNWQRRVRSGEVEFTPAREDDLKDGFRAFIALSGLLCEKFDAFHKQNLFLVKPRRIGVLQAQENEAEKILDSWMSPEWEVTDTRIVKWDKAQTDYLLQRLGSRA